MAALASTAVSLYPTDGSAESYPNGQGDRSVVQRRLKLVLTGQGIATTDTIGAAALGFETLISCSTLYDATNNKGYPAAVDPANNIILLFDGAAAPAPVAVTTTVAYITVIGTPPIY